MQVRGKILLFEWDSGNIDNNYLTHGILPKETEEVFVSDTAIVLPDVKHSEKEERFIIVGTSSSNVHLFIVFTVRESKIRVISARKMHREEVERYEKIKKDTKI